MLFARPISRLASSFKSFRAIQYIQYAKSSNQPIVEKFRKYQWGALATFTGLVLGGVLYVNKGLQEGKKRQSSALGRPAIGGNFNLIDHNGKPCTLDDFRGKWVLLYFGFCRCPDICPELVERLVEIYDRLTLLGKPKQPLVPVFVTVDPERDTPKVVADYLGEFSPHLVGLTGTKEEVDKAAKNYRIYYSAGPKDASGDYIVDHTVVLYLIDPKGQFSDYYGQQKEARDIVYEILKKMKDYKE